MRFVKTTHKTCVTKLFSACVFPQIWWSESFWIANLYDKMFHYSLETSKIEKIRKISNFRFTWLKKHLDSNVRQMIRESCLLGNIWLWQFLKWIWLFGLLKAIELDEVLTSQHKAKVESINLPFSRSIAKCRCFHVSKKKFKISNASPSFVLKKDNVNNQLQILWMFW